MKQFSFPVQNQFINFHFILNTIRIFSQVFLKFFFSNNFCNYNFFLKGIENYSPNVKKWDSKDVSNFIQTIPGCIESSDVFNEHVFKMVNFLN